MTQEPSSSMDSNGGHNGIELLLAAEEEAQHNITMARNAKLDRLKEAKEEAERELAEFRAQMEVEYQKKLAESSSDLGSNVKRMEVETESKILHLKLQSANISNEVVQLKYVTTVKN